MVIRGIVAAGLIAGMSLVVGPVEAKTKPVVVDTEAVTGCTGIHLSAEETTLGLPIDQHYLATWLGTMMESKTTGARQQAKKILKSPTGAAQVFAVKKVAAWCDSIGLPAITTSAPR